MTTTDLAPTAGSSATSVPTADGSPAGADARADARDDARADARGARRSGVRLTFVRVVRAEWIKQQTLASTRWVLLGLLVAIGGFGLLAASTATGGTAPAGNGGGPDFAGQDPLSIVMSGANFGMLLVAVLGTLVGAREYGSGLIRTTIAAVPSRLPVLFAKVLAFLGSVVPVVVVGVAVAFTGGMAILDNAGSASLSWSDAGVVQALVGQVAYLSALGVIGVALGSVMRAIAGGLAVVIGGLLFVPALATALLPSSWSEALKYLPSTAGDAMTSLTTQAGALSAGAGAAVLVAWVVGTLGLAAALLRRRDV